MAISGTTSGPELLVELDRAGPEPLHRQLANGLRDAIRTGRLAPATRLPSTRVLATDLGVSRRLVVDAYSQLTAEGFLLSRHGSGTRVATVDAASARRRTPTRRQSDSTSISHPAHRISVAFRGTRGCGRCGRASRRDRVACVRLYVAPQGLHTARVAVADYLRRTRGVLADPQQIVLCSGATQAIALLASVLTDETMAMEDPGFWLHRMGLATQRHRSCAGFPSMTTVWMWPPLRIAVRRAVACRRGFHQSPTGVVLSATRRTALVQWARADHLVIEDDYDAEYRYDRAPVGALQGIAPDRVVYVGSTSKTLAPGLRIGWMVLPAYLVGPVALSKGLADTGSSVMDQLAFAKLLTSGGYDRHLRQMRRRYVARRSALLQALARYLPEATVLGAAAGLHLTVRFPDDCPIAELVRSAADMRVRVEPLAPCYADEAAAPPGLMLGYANVTETQIIEGMRVLARAMQQAST